MGGGSAASQGNTAPETKELGTEEARPEREPSGGSTVSCHLFLLVGPRGAQAGRVLGLHGGQTEMLIKKLNPL